MPSLHLLFSTWFIQTLLFSTTLWGLDVGEEIIVDKDEQSFGVIFSLGQFDIDGTQWMLRFSNPEPFEPQTTWNFYHKEKEQFIWTTPKPVPPENLFQAHFQDHQAIQIVPHQRNLILVFSEKLGRKSYLDLAKMCQSRDWQPFFKNITNAKRCDEISLSDVE